ncbi:MAG: Flp family type IVb pilin [Vulcanimicrobiaceae bacterium]
MAEIGMLLGLRGRIREFAADDSGSEIVEYAIILAVFVVITVSAIGVVGNVASSQVNGNAAGMQSAAVSTPG